MTKRRARLRPEAEATQFILSEDDKPCLKVQWINDYKGMLDIIPDVYCVNITRHHGDIISQHNKLLMKFVAIYFNNNFLSDFIDCSPNHQFQTSPNIIQIFFSLLKSLTFVCSAYVLSIPDQLQLVNLIWILLLDTNQ